MSYPTLGSGENPIADAAAAKHISIMLATGMAYEFTPDTIARRAFLDGFAAGAVELRRVAAERDSLQAEITAADEGDMQIRDENAALRARNAELVAVLREIADESPKSRSEEWVEVVERIVQKAHKALTRSESGATASGWLDRHAENFHQVISAEGSDTPASDCTAPTQAKPPMLVGGSYDCPRCGERHPVGPCKNFEKTPAKHRWAYVSGFGEAATWKCHICGNVVHGDSLDEAVRDSEVGPCDAARSHKGPTP